MNVRYFPDTDILLITLSNARFTEPRDLNDNILIELDDDGRLVNMTIEHATQQTDVREFSFQQVAIYAFTMLSCSLSLPLSPLLVVRHALSLSFTRRV